MSASHLSCYHVEHACIKCYIIIYYSVHRSPFELEHAKKKKQKKTVWTVDSTYTAYTHLSIRTFSSFSRYRISAQFLAVFFLYCYITILCSYLHLFTQFYRINMYFDQHVRTKRTKRRGGKPINLDIAFGVEIQIQMF